MTFYPKNPHKYSTGILVLGVGNMHEYVKNLLQISNLKLISVGSGNGVIEKNLEQKFEIEIICIDPTPLAWSLSIEENKLPQYKTTNELINCNNNLINNCNLIINWSYPDFYYDLESIIMLKPRNIIIITDLSEHHGAGGYELHEFMKLCGVPTNVKITNKTKKFINKKIKKNELHMYNYVYRTYTKYHSVHGILELSLIWLSLDLINNDSNKNIEVRNSDDYINALAEHNL